jgi:serine/threonine protein kinase
MNKTPKSWLFKPIINGNNSWAELFQSICAFTPIIEAIFIKHELEIGEIENLTPGTNAVFRINDKVIKIFAPIESGYSTGDDYFIELSALKHANNVRITAPFLVCAGSIEDRYLFRYIVMDFISGQDAEHKLMLYQTKQKSNLAYKLKAITQKLNTIVSQTEIPILELNDCLENKRWNEFPQSFCQDRKIFIGSKNFSDFVYTHGDLTGENMIINDDDDIYIIDFADSRIAPYYYEWSPIVFALFGCC